MKPFVRVARELATMEKEQLNAAELTNLDPASFGAGYLLGVRQALAWVLRESATDPFTLWVKEHDPRTRRGG